MSTTPLVHDAPIVLPAPTAPRYPVELGEVLGLAVTLEAAGCDPGPHIQAAHDIAAVVSAVEPSPSTYYSDGLLNLTPTEVAQRLRQAGAEVASADHQPRLARVHDPARTRRLRCHP